MKSFYYLVFGMVFGILITWAGYLMVRPPAPPPSPRTSTAEVMGKCLQGQQVLYRVDRSRAAGNCAYDLANNRTRFFRTWENYQTEEGSW